MTSMGDRAGQQARAFQDRGLGQEARQDYSSLVAGAKQVRGTRLRRRNTILSVAAAAGVALMVGVFYPSQEQTELAEAPSPPAFQVEGVKAAPILGETIEASGRDQAIRFQGGEMTLAEGSRGRVLSLHDRGADVALLDGEIRCDIAPGRGGRWTIQAGDYQVTMIGTIFLVRYDLEEKSFEVSVNRGIVDVTGPGITGVERLKKGEALALPQDDVEPTDDAPVPEKNPIEPTLQKKQGLPWKKLAEQGKYREAMKQVEDSGFSSTAGSLSVGDLVRLADVARMAGRSDRATNLLHRIRKTAPGSHHAATAAYSLGTTAFDQRGDYAGAARWFSTYLSEAPGGPLSQEALGRMMEAQHRAGMTTAATDSARKYLKAYPTGPHRVLAQKLIAK